MPWRVVALGYVFIESMHQLFFLYPSYNRSFRKVVHVVIYLYALDAFPITLAVAVLPKTVIDNGYL